MLSREVMVCEEFEVDANASNMLRSEGERSEVSTRGECAFEVESSGEMGGIEGGRSSDSSDFRSACNLSWNSRQPLSSIRLCAQSTF